MTTPTEFIRYVIKADIHNKKNMYYTNNGDWHEDITKAYLFWNSSEAGVNACDLDNNVFKNITIERITLSALLIQDVNPVEMYRIN